MPHPDDIPLQNYCADFWEWNKQDKSYEVRVLGDKHQRAFFHPKTSHGSAGVRGTRILNKGQFYWEINITKRIFGTSMMFGIGTKKARLDTNNFTNMLGEDEHSWGLSHKGLVWHKGIGREFTTPFQESQPTTIGLFFDGVKGTLAYYKDSFPLGVAFSQLDLVEDEIYPMICSTAAKSEMSLGIALREFISLQDRCHTVILNHTREEVDIEKLELPTSIKIYLKEEADHIRNMESSYKCDNINCIQNGFK